jgi:poly-D-alanine transfer protein DltD
LVICWAAPAQKFPPIAGEIYGQAAPGVRAISVNGKPVKFDAAQNFKATVSLKAGERYLVLRVNYGDLRIVKKYLILRKPAVKSFKVFVPKEKMEKEIKAATPSSVQLSRRQREKLLARRKKALAAKLQAKQQKLRAEQKPARPKQATAEAAEEPAKPKTIEYLYVWEFSDGKLLLVREENGEYAAEINIPVSKEWLDLKGLSKQELSELIKQQSAQTEKKGNILPWNTKQ